MLFVAASESCEGLPPTIRRCFSHELSVGPLTEEQRTEMLSRLLKGVPELFSDVRPVNFILFNLLFYVDGVNNIKSLAANTKL